MEKLLFCLIGRVGRHVQSASLQFAKDHTNQKRYKNCNCITIIIIIIEIKIKSILQSQHEVDMLCVRSVYLHWLLSQATSAPSQLNHSTQKQLFCNWLSKNCLLHLHFAIAIKNGKPPTRDQNRNRAKINLFSNFVSQLT